MTIFQVETRAGLVDFVLIEREDGSELTMPKSVWDAQQDAETL